MQLELVRQVIRMPVERILSDVLPDETGASRLQQVGLFTLVFMLQGDKKAVTASRLAQITGQSEGEIGKKLQKMIDLELLKRTEIRNKQGRGRAYQLSVNYSAKSKRLLKAIEKATVGAK